MVVLIIFNFLPETTKSSLCVTYGYMTIFNFQYNQWDMLYFSTLLHHWGVGTQVHVCCFVHLILTQGWRFLFSSRLTLGFNEGDIQPLSCCTDHAEILPFYGVCIIRVTAAGIELSKARPPTECFFWPELTSSRPFTKTAGQIVKNAFFLRSRLYVFVLND